jgi:hypothetical protein
MRTQIVAIALLGMASLGPKISEVIQSAKASQAPEALYMPLPEREEEEERRRRRR